MRWHNSGGLTETERRRKYMRRLMQGVDIAGICETSWKDGAMEEGARKLAQWDPQIRADLYTGGQYERASGSGRNAGLALLVKKGVATDVAQRDHGDATLQCMITDICIRGSRFRLVLSHGDPYSDMRAKEAHYRGVQREPSQKSTRRMRRRGWSVLVIC